MLNDKQKSGLDPLIKAAMKRQAGVGESTINCIAICAVSLPARARFGHGNASSCWRRNFKPNQQLAGMKSAQSAIKFVVNGGGKHD